MKIIILTGRLTSDPEIKTVGDKDVKLAKFSIANNDVSKETAEYYEINCWEGTADFAEKFLKKGNRILVHGTFSKSPYTDKDGKRRTSFEVSAYKIEFAD